MGSARCHVIPGRMCARQEPPNSLHFKPRVLTLNMTLITLTSHNHTRPLFLFGRLEAKTCPLPTLDSGRAKMVWGAGKACGTSAFGGLVLNQAADRCPARARFHNSTSPFPSVPREQTTRPIFILPNCSACRATRSCSVLAQLRASGGSQAPAAGCHATEALLNPTQSTNDALSRTRPPEALYNSPPLMSLALSLHAPR
jgi:hypothetical protein